MRPPALDLAGRLFKRRIDERVRAALSAYEASQAALQLEIAKQIPDLELGPAYQYDQGENKWALGFTATLPVFNRNQGAIAVAEARRTEAAAKFKALQARAISEVEQARTAYRSALEKLDAAQRMSSDLKQREKTAQALLAAREVSRLEITADRIERAAVEQSGLEARLDALLALGDLENALHVPSDLPDWAKRIPFNASAIEEKKHE